MTSDSPVVLAEFIQEGFRQLTRDKVDPWLFMREQGLQVTRIDGSAISYQGIEFDGSPRDLFWDSNFIDPFLRAAAKVWTETAAGTAREQHHDVAAVLDFVEGSLISETNRLLARMIDVDRRLRGKGFPDSIQPDAGRANAKLVTFTTYVQALISIELSQEQANARTIMIQSAEKASAIFDSYSTWLTASYAAFTALVISNKDKIPPFITPGTITAILAILAVMIVLVLKQKWNAVTVAASAAGEAIGRGIAEHGASKNSLTLMAKLAIDGSIWPLRRRTRRRVQRAMDGDFLSDAKAILRSAQWQGFIAGCQTILVCCLVAWLTYSSATYAPANSAAGSVNQSPPPALHWSATAYRSADRSP